MGNETKGFLMLFEIFAGKGNALGANFNFFLAVNFAYHRAMRPGWAHTALIKILFRQCKFS